MIACSLRSKKAVNSFVRTPYESIKDTVFLKEGGGFAFACDDDYAVFDAKGNELDYDRVGLICTGYCEPDNLSLRFVKDDY